MPSQAGRRPRFLKSAGLVLAVTLNFDLLLFSGILAIVAAVPLMLGNGTPAHFVATLLVHGKLLGFDHERRAAAGVSSSGFFAGDAL